MIIQIIYNILIYIITIISLLIVVAYFTVIERHVLAIIKNIKKLRNNYVLSFFTFTASSNTQQLEPRLIVGDNDYNQYLVAFLRGNDNIPLNNSCKSNNFISQFVDKTDPFITSLYPGVIPSNIGLNKGKGPFIQIIYDCGLNFNAFNYFGAVLGTSAFIGGLLYLFLNINNTPADFFIEQLKYKFCGFERISQTADFKNLTVSQNVVVFKYFYSIFKLDKTFDEFEDIYLKVSDCIRHVDVLRVIKNKNIKISIKEEILLKNIIRCNSADDEGDRLKSMNYLLQHCIKKSISTNGFIDIFSGYRDFTAVGIAPWVELNIGNAKELYIDNFLDNFLGNTNLNLFHVKGLNINWVLIPLSLKTSHKGLFMDLHKTGGDRLLAYKFIKNYIQVSGYNSFKVFCKKIYSLDS